MSTDNLGNTIPDSTSGNTVEIAQPTGTSQKPSEISQTLFRFVSFRNPQLTETKDHPGFIERPENSTFKGVFDTAIKELESGSLKFPTLESTAKTFETSPDSGYLDKESRVEELDTKLFALGKALYKDDEPDAKLMDNLSKSVVTDSVKKQLWDNLIYQVVTQKSFYVKEAVIRMLKAIHYLEYYTESKIPEDKNGQELLKNAKVVLPAYLFMDDVSDESNEEKPFIVNVSNVNEGVINLETTGKSTANRTAASANVVSQAFLQDAEATKALVKKDALQQLKKELEKLQKTHAKTYHKAYQTALADYNAEVQPQIAAYETQLQAVEDSFTEQTTEADKKAAYDRITPLNIPAFEFTFDKEVRLSHLDEKLSPQSFSMLMELIAEYDEAEMQTAAEANKGEIANRQVVSDTEMLVNSVSVSVEEDDYGTYADILKKVDAEISTQFKAALSAKEMPQKQYANIGGVLVPVMTAKGTTEKTVDLFAHSERSFWGIYNSYIRMTINVGDDSWGLASAKLTAVINGNNVEENCGAIAVTNNKIELPTMLYHKFKTNISSLILEVVFQNGKKGSAEFSEFGVFNSDYLTSSNLKINSDGDGASGSASTGTLQPKRFGVRRLGIADYLKVEQSVHAYVPGEVSNIENVMASELRHKSVSETQRSETTTDTIKSQEVEKLSDTTKVNRTELQTEVAKELERQQSFEAHANYSKDTGIVKFDIGGSYANNTAQHDSTRQAVAKSQEITERALERVVTKVSEERIQKIVHEVTLQNVHEFDNRGKIATAVGAVDVKPQHITGVYRWVDKKMKNQIYNYGKRTMFEFMIPEPARLHRLATQASLITAPEDPRKAKGQWLMADPNVDVLILQHWADIFSVTLDEQLKDIEHKHVASNSPNTDGDFGTDITSIQIEENYVGKSVVFSGYANRARMRGGFWQGEPSLSATIHFSSLVGGDIWRSDYGNLSTNDSRTGLNLTGNVDFNVGGNNISSYSITARITCQPSDELVAKWKKTQFDKIIDAYKQAYSDFQKAQADAAAAAQEKKDKLAAFYRDIEANVIKHNCIAYLLQDYLSILGTQFDEGKTMEEFKINLGEDLDKYTALAKFIEQAFEWSVMDYTFYPYFWANRSHWQEMYLTEETDPLFRNFLQAGMARVIVTVKPGFEDAVQFFMSTGRIWNGGEVPVIGDPLYLSIVDELRQPTGKPQGKYWITRVPTTLTILQDKSTGLPVNQPLPIFPETDIANCENPKELEFKTSFETRDVQMLATPGTSSTIPTDITNVYNEKTVIQ